MMSSSAPGRFLSKKEVAAQTSLSKATIDRRRREGTFPEPLSLGGGRVAWTERSIEDWKRTMLEAAN